MTTTTKRNIFYIENPLSGNKGVINMETRNWGLSEVERRLLKKWAAAIKVMTPKEKEKMLTVADTIILMKELKEEGRSA